ncbi:hypothetical protein [Amphibiibacter pelophylacis]|uniref:Uncharacterized protein n=1 Tax=Amphibiibacter pelophylacis TaxID=1799477 RepID=A0ACC6P4G0_9BURK
MTPSDATDAPSAPGLSGLPDLSDLPVLDQVLQPAPSGLSREQIQARVRQALKDEVRAEIREDVRAEVRAEVRDDVRDELRAELLRELEPRCREEARVAAQAQADAQAQQRWQLWLRDELPALIQQQTQAGQQQWVECITRGVLQQSPVWAEAIQRRVLADLQQHLNQSLEPLAAHARIHWGQALQSALNVPDKGDPPPKN